MSVSSPFLKECIYWLKNVIPYCLKFCTIFFQICYNALQEMSTKMYWVAVKKAVPLQAWSGPEGSRKLRFPDFVTTAQDGGKVVSLTHRPPLPPGNSPCTHFCLLSQPKGHNAIGRFMSTKNYMTPSGIEPATFQFVAQHLNHCAAAVPTE